MGVYGPFNEDRSGGYRLTLGAYAKYIFFFTWRVGGVAKTFKRKSRFFGLIKYWARQEADSIQITNTYFKDKYLQEPDETASRTCNNAKSCRLQRGQTVVSGDPDWQSVSSNVIARIGATTLETNADAEFGQG